jgi:hypothetical protein
VNVNAVKNEENDSFSACKRQHTPTKIHQELIASKNSETVPYAKKIVATVFCDAQGVLLEQFLPGDETINAARYCGTLHRLRDAVRRERQGRKRDGLTMPHDNGTPHTAW